MTLRAAASISAAAVAPVSGAGITVNVFGGSNYRTLYKITTTFAAFAAAALTADLTLATFAAKMKLCSLICDQTVAFSGGGTTASSLQAGTSAGAVDLLANFSTFAGTATKGLADADLGTAMVRAAATQGGDLPAAGWGGTWIISARMTTVTANTNALTQGSATWYVETLQYP